MKGTEIIKAMGFNGDAHPELFKRLQMLHGPKHSPITIHCNVKGPAVSDAMIAQTSQNLKTHVSGLMCCQATLCDVGCGQPPTTPQEGPCV